MKPVDRLTVALARLGARHLSSSRIVSYSRVMTLLFQVIPSRIGFFNRLPARN